MYTCTLPGSFLHVILMFQCGVVLYSGIVVVDFTGAGAGTGTGRGSDEWILISTCTLYKWRLRQLTGRALVCRHVYIYCSLMPRMDTYMYIISIMSLVFIHHYIHVIHSSTTAVLSRLSAPVNTTELDLLLTLHCNINISACWRYVQSEWTGVRRVRMWANEGVYVYV